MDVVNSTFTTLVPKIIENATKISFSWYDYILFSSMLGISALIGVYFGCFGSKQSTADEYLMGDKQMKVFPISVSLVASHVSGITLLAVPADIYMFGSSYFLIILGFLAVCFITMYIFLPVFYKLSITSTYEYLERRFNSKIRCFASFLFALGLVLYLPIVIYIPALAFSAATGINVHYITPIVCGVCIFYTTLGGLKAVVWTDTLQFIVTVGAVVTVFVLGLRSAGGFGPVWTAAAKGQRLNVFDFDPDPTKRDSFWITTIGTSIGLTGMMGIHQSCVQKFLSVPTFADAKRCVVYFTIGIIGVSTFSIFIGLIMYARYADCDPFTTGAVQKPDQLLPYYILDVAAQIPGLSGLFIAGIFCAALSTLSASLNCLSGTIYEDFVSKLIKTKKNSRQVTTYLKIIVVICGLVCTALVYVIEHLGGILPLAISLAGVTTGPLLTMFTVGVLFPRVSSKGCLYGSIVGLVFASWIVVMAQYYKAQGLIVYEHKPISVEGCENFLGNYTSVIEEYTTTTSSFLLPETTTEFVKSEENLPFILFRISYYYYTPFGTLVGIIASILISWICRNDDPPVHRDLLSPIIYRFLSDESVIRTEKEYYSVEKALHLVTIAHNEKEKN